MKKKKILFVGDAHVFLAMGYFKLLSDQYKIDVYWSAKYKKHINNLLKKNHNFLFTHKD